MKTNWKALSRTPGYMSMKAAIIKDLNRTRPHRTKEENIKLFHWVICRAKHYAHHEGIPLDQVLNRWENKRMKDKAFWWYGYYSDFKFPKYRKKRFKTNLIKYYKKQRTYGRKDRQARSERMIRALQNQAENARKELGKKPRWDTERKKRAKRLREYYAKEESVS